MISSISSSASLYSSSLNQQSQQTQRQPPPPPEEDTFQLADTNEDGVVSAEELAAAIGSVEEVTSTSISQDEVLASYDQDDDSGLNGEEFLDMLSGYGVAPAEGGPSSENSGGIQPPAPSMSMALDAYSQNSGFLQNSGNAPIDSLIELLSSDDDESAIFSINVEG